MVFWVLLSSALACTLPSLPPSLSYFSSTFSSSGQLTAFGSFLASDTSYQVDLQQDSWLRLTIEPQNHATEIQLLKDDKIILSDKANHNGLAKLFGKLEAGTYNLQVSMESVIEGDNSNTISCQKPNLLLNFGILPADQVNLFESTAKVQDFPDISGILPVFNSTIPFSETYEPFFVSSKSLNKKVVFEFPIRVPKLLNQFKDFGFTGMWQVTFSLRKS